ncbi:hypothetical protein BD779DRAFT_86532 [Infundibulicybe gibba]|nr:hypothetical protein BD779DRAFT_86532 [Infundibulicybe gibba]
MGRRHHLCSDLIGTQRVCCRTGMLILLKIPEGSIRVEVHGCGYMVSVILETYTPAMGVPTPSPRLCSFLVAAFGCWVMHSVSILGYHLSFSSVIVPPGFSIIVVLETIVHSITQGTYIFRMYLFGQNRYILACCCMLVLLEVGFGLTWAGHVAVSDTIQEVHTRDQGVEWVITAFFVISASVDVFITASVSRQLRRSRMNGFKQTKYLIDRVIRWTISTGMLTSSVAITIILLWYFNRDSFIWGGMCTIEPGCELI